MITVAFDTETTGLNPWKGDRPFSISFCWEDGTTVYFEWYVDPFTRKPDPPTEDELRFIRNIISNPNIRKVGHNLKFDLRMVEIAWGIELQGPIDDTLFMAHAADPSEPTHELKPLAKKYRKIDDHDEAALDKAVTDCRRYARKQGWKIHDETAADKWLPYTTAIEYPEILKQYLGINQLNRIYCDLDTIRTMLLWSMYREVLDADPVANSVYQREIGNWDVVYDMETIGVRVYPEICRSELEYCEKRTAELRRRISDVFGNFKKKITDNQIRAYLFDPPELGGLGLTPDPDRLCAKAKDKNGNRLPSVAREILEELAPTVPMLEVKVEYDKLVKAASYYRHYLKNMVEETTNVFVIHPNFNQCGPVTGRLSCRNPNLQNVPKRAKEGDIMQRVRRPFGPRPGYVWLHLDWKAIEARIFAEEAGESDMLRIFRENGDVYQELVKRVEEITGLDLKALLAFADSAGKPGTGARQICKNNFLGWTYGEGKRKMKRAMRLASEELALKIIAALKAGYPLAVPFMKRMQKYARKHGCIINRYGRRVPVPPPTWKDGDIEEYYYIAVNYLIQSTAADMMKTAKRRCRDFLREHYSTAEARIVMTIHDELVFEIRKPVMTVRLVNELRYIMKLTAEEFYNNVEFPVEASVTRTNWDKPTELKVAA